MHRDRVETLANDLTRRVRRLVQEAISYIAKRRQVRARELLERRRPSRSDNALGEDPRLGIVADGRHGPD